MTPPLMKDAKNALSVGKYPKQRPKSQKYGYLPLFYFPKIYKICILYNCGSVAGAVLFPERICKKEK